MASQPVNVSAEVCDQFSVVFAFDWPAACGWGPTLDAALAHLWPDIAFMADWLTKRGLDVPAPPAAFEPAIGERLIATGDPAVECDSEGFYSWDAEPFSDGELVQTAMLLGFSRAELMAVVNGLSDAALDLRLVEGKRTIREILDHIAIAEWWYTTRVMADPGAARSWRDYGTDAHSRLAAVRDLYLREHLPRLAGMTEEERRRRLTLGRETWSARKTLRRAFWHEMLHYKQLLRLVPKVLRAVSD
ncbi:MAG: DinB family protein [Chloroflexota bacterium]